LPKNKKIKIKRKKLESLIDAALAEFIFSESEKRVWLLGLITQLSGLAFCHVFATQ
jgi:hypothetical protein